MQYDYDLLVLGGGAAGLVAASVAVNLGKRVALVEARKTGGECTWYGCIPSKALIKSATLVHNAGHLYDHGLAGKKVTGLRPEDGLKRVQKVVRTIYSHETPKVLEAKGITVIMGKGQFIDGHHVKVKGKMYSAKKFVIATGSEPFVPPIENIDSVPYLTNETVFALKKPPASMIVLGGGAIGIEMGQAFQYLGTKVTVVEMLNRIIPRDDPELTGMLAQRLSDEGMTVLTGHRAVRVMQKGNQLELTVVNEKEKKRIVKAETLLVAVGRKPRVHGLGLEAAGVQYDNGGLALDKYLRTSVPHIFAAGDVAGPFLFSHMCEYQGITAATNAMLPVKRKVDYSHVPWVTYTDPEIAHSGLTEEEAVEKYGTRIRVYRKAYGDLDRGITDGTEFGLAKFITRKNGKLLGIHIMGARAGELMHEAHVMKAMGIPFHKLNGVIHAYPSYSDMVRHPARDAYVDRIRNNPLVRLVQFFMRGDKNDE
ncbi:MAG: dihydrolipoyl dehydrogenase family protein [Spirochaetota bacterium]